MYNAFKREFAKIWAAFNGRKWRDLRIRMDFKSAVKFQILDMGVRGKGKNVISLQMGHKEMIQTPKGHLPGGHKNHIELRTKDGRKMTIPHGGRAYLDPPNQNLPIKGKDFRVNGGFAFYNHLFCCQAHGYLRACCAVLVPKD